MTSLKNLLLGLATSAALLSGTAAASDWDIDPTHSSISFTVDHMVISEVQGKFDQFSGTITGFDAADASKAKVSATIQTGSVNTSNKDRDDHLKSPDFFDAEKFPTATFTSTAIKKTGEGKYEITGDFTLHGVTKSITIPVKMKGPITDPWGNVRTGFEGTINLDRTAYGLTWSKTLETGGLVVGNDVALTLRVEAVQKK